MEKFFGILIISILTNFAVNNFTRGCFAFA